VTQLQSGTLRVNLFYDALVRSGHPADLQNNSSLPVDVQPCDPTRVQELALSENLPIAPCTPMPHCGFGGPNPLADLGFRLVSWPARRRICLRLKRHARRLLCIIRKPIADERVGSFAVRRSIDYSFD
jgi:hypothetical protein